MDQNQIKPEEQVLDGTKSLYKEKPKLREISEKELKQILKDHQKWLDSNGNDGERADLSYANLRGHNLEEANLQRANLQGSDLQEADLKKADLREVNMQKVNLFNACLKEAKLSVPFSGKKWEKNYKNADLRGASLISANFQNTLLRGVNFEGADLSSAHFNDADLCFAKFHNTVLDRADFTNAHLTHAEGLNNVKSLQDTKLEAVIGLKGNEFFGSDLTGVILPEGISKFATLQVAEETSKNARKIFFAMLLGCVYSWLTIATTTDVGLLTNSATSPLPIIGTKIPIAWFYLAAPFVIICLYIYFHLYLLKLWEGLAGLPAIFSDGKRLDERAYPWLLNGLVRRHFKLLRTGRPIMAHVQELITIFLAWWVVPFTMIGFWLRYLPRHEWIGTYLHIVLIALSFAAAIVFYRLAVIKLRRVDREVFRNLTFWRDRRLYYGIIVVLLGLMFGILSNSTINGIKLEKGTKAINVDLKNLKKIVPWSFQRLRYNPFANLREKDVSTKPDNYYLIASDEKKIESVKGANLRARNLAFADMVASFLVKADLREANLQYADLTVAILTHAKLNGANLHGTILREARLHSASFNNSNLFGADLRRTDLQRASFLMANLQKAKIGGANLHQANLYRANLKEADLRGAREITVEQMCQAETLYKTILDSGLEEKVIKECPEKRKKPKDKNN